MTYSSITLSSIAKYGIVIEQDHENGSPTGEPTSGVPVMDITVENVNGAVASGGKNFYVLCASCKSWCTDHCLSGWREPDGDRKQGG